MESTSFRSWGNISWYMITTLRVAHLPKTSWYLEQIPHYSTQADAGRIAPGSNVRDTGTKHISLGELPRVFLMHVQHPCQKVIRRWLQCHLDRAICRLLFF